MSPLRAVLLCILTSSTSVVYAQISSDSVRALYSFVEGGESLVGLPLTIDHDLTLSLSDTPGSFAYDFKTLAWPTGWSVYGLNPQLVQLYFGAIPFDGLLTGRPNYDLLPTPLLKPPEVDAGFTRWSYWCED